jgi:DNA-binding response OmpR family regulator
VVGNPVGDTQNYSILLVESDKRESDKLKYIFDGMYQFSVRADVESALEHIEKEPPDIVLTNIKFSSLESFLQVTDDLDGFYLCEHIKRHKRRDVRDIHVIFLTDSEDSRDSAKAFELGASDYIRKPYDILDLFSRIEIKLKRKEEKSALYSSIKDLIEDKKVRNKKNLDFRTSLFNKHKSDISKYQIELDRLRGQISEFESKIEFYKRFQSENRKLREQLDALQKQLNSASESDLSSESEDSGSSDEDTNSEDIELIKDVLKEINAEFRFEEIHIREIVNKILGQEFSFDKVDNLSFINSIVDVIKIFTKNELLDLESEPPLRDQIKDNLDSLVEYISKTYINRYLFYFAVALLESIGEKSQNAINFLKFYDGQVEITPNGVRFQKPTIQGENGSLWNIVSILQIVGQRAKGKEIVVEQQKSIDDTKAKLNNVKNQIYTVVSRDKLLTNDKLKQKVSFAKKIEIIEDTLNEEKREIPKTDKDAIGEVELKIIKLHNISKLAEKYENFIRQESKKMEKLINYYKPTEEKFSRIALSIAKSFLKIKIIK